MIYLTVAADISMDISLFLIYEMHFKNIHTLIKGVLTLCCLSKQYENVKVSIQDS